MPQGKNFAGQNLRGRSFAGLDLRGADFRGAQLAGANFTGADLRSANFAGADAQRACFAAARFGRTLPYAIAPHLAAGALAGMFSALGVALNGGLLSMATGHDNDRIVGWAGLLISLALVMIALWKGRRAGAFAVAVAFAVSFAVSFAHAVSFAVAGAVAVSFAVAVAGAGAWHFASSVYVLWNVQWRDEKFLRAEPASAWFRSLGGTSFRQANLSGATFAGANIAGVNFTHAILTRVCWSQTRNLHLSRLGPTILRERAVETLVTTGRIANGEGADLRGVNLDGFRLSGVSFRHADLTGASLRGTNLESANLAETMCIGADFSAAQLTGACLEAWNIDASTILDEVDCRYVFFRDQPDERGDRERRPHDPKAVFEPGDFSKLYQQAMTTMEILLRQGVTREALGLAFGDLMAAHPEIAPDAVQSVERKGDDLLLRMNVPPGSDKGKIEEVLQSALHHQLLLEQERVKMLGAHNQDLKEIAMTALAGGSASIVVGGSIMAKEDRSIRVKGDLTIENSGTFSLSGDVHHAVQTLAGREPELAKLLAELGQRLAASPQLSVSDKSLAAEKVVEIAQAAAAPAADSVLKKTGRAALMTLKGLAGALPDVAKVIEAVGKAMDAIGKIG